MNQAPPNTTLILDFDGTISLRDMGDALCTAFAEPSWRQWDERYKRGQLSLDEAQRGMWSTFRASEEEVAAFIGVHGRLRSGLGELLGAAEGAQVPVVIASGGFDYYIRAILRTELSRFEALWTNELRLVGGGCQLRFPLRGSYGCPSCAVCKGAIVRHYQRRGDRVVYAGDGESDRCAVGVADVIYTVRGSALASQCERERVAHTPFDTFHLLLQSL